MEQLIQKTKELEECAIELTDIPKDYPFLLEKLDKIKLQQKQIEAQIGFTADQILDEQYQKWQQEKETYLHWIETVCLKIKELQYQEQEFSSLEKKNLENLIHFLTKYNAIYTKISNEETSSRIQKQINDLYQNIFKTTENLIKQPDHQEKKKIEFELFSSVNIPKEPKEEPQGTEQSKEPLKPIIEEQEEFPLILNTPLIEEEKIEEEKPQEPGIKIDTVTPFFKEDEPLNKETIKEKLYQYAELTNQSYEDLQKEFFPVKEEKKPIPKILYHIQDSFKIPLNAKLYPDETVDKSSMTNTSCYTPEVKRKIYAIGLKKEQEIIQTKSQSEVEKLVQEGFSIISIASLCKNKVEGWYQIKDIEVE